MKKYLLIVIGDFTPEGITQDIALALTPLVDSEHLKFQKTDTVLIFHFATSVSEMEVKDYIYGVLFGLSNTYILTEMNDNVSVVMPEEFKNHLMNLEEGTADKMNSLEMVKIKNNQYNSDEMVDDELNEEILALLLGKKKYKARKISLDTVLDKINEKGIESLTTEEKSILESYSKN